MRPFAPDQRGVGLVEIVVATVIAVIAVVALAYAFGTGRGLVDRYAAARVALGAAQRRMEVLATLAPSSPDLQIGAHGPIDVVLEGRSVARESWQVAGWDDPADGLNGDADLKQVTVRVAWGPGPNDSIVLRRLLPLN